MLAARLIPSPTEELRAALGVPADGEVAFLLRRILINEQPTAIYRSWFDARLVPGIERAPGVEGSLSDTLESEYGFVPARSELSLEVVRSTGDEGLLVSAGADVPLLVVTSTSYLPDGRPLEYAQMAWLGDRVRFHVTPERATA